MLNLVALAFRPLRLCVPSEQLRRARIVLLKVTHFPFVAAITAYECGQHFLSNRRTRRAFGVSSLGGPGSRTLSAFRPRGSVSPDALFGASLSSARPLTAAEPSPTHAKQDDAPARRRSPSYDLQQTVASPAASNDDIRDLRAVVVRLGAQVEELTAVVMQQQHQDSGHKVRDGLYGSQAK
ncbi:MAG: hypothetical protein M1821_000856 [Bathelium mastoideum]|nr:MAG: hypothetical protein M1821_000856 [Bathelium mastoideum]